MRVLLAGGGGFIGSHLADAMLERGDEVVVVDNFTSGRRSNVAHLASVTGFALIDHDVTEPLAYHGAAREPFDVVLDLASPASPTDFATSPLAILAVGSTGTRNLLHRSVADGASFFLASTSEVYGDPLVHPQPETYWGNVDPIGPRSCYDEAKRFSEALTMAYKRVHDVDVRIARIFNTYGPRMRPDDGRVITNFIVQAFEGTPITLYGDGTQTRSFCYVSDEVRGLLAVIDGPDLGPVNVGSTWEFTMRELAELVLELTGSSSEIVTVELPPERQGDPRQRQPDSTLIREKLGWEPVVPLREGLAMMIDHFRAEEMR